ncbi:hypothetical protein BUALT_Bualt19G0082100 [Buddleja alternifolia]|uniref:Uncharacterized protein n=1 Tax=Buddleja alternifolia TaxID=168488 RepID=A0AAV6WAD4_9LAMI|nr:hypothetical protein BUALT_Bualt19G0082100 [Buddleja alternifolia]
MKVSVGTQVGLSCSREEQHPITQAGAKGLEIWLMSSATVAKDQVSRKMIAQGPKVGRLFPLFLFLSSLLSNHVACNAV